jgi:hypothetical protein
VKEEDTAVDEDVLCDRRSDHCDSTTLCFCSVELQRVKSARIYGVYIIKIFLKLLLLLKKNRNYINISIFIKRRRFIKLILMPFS